ncbi:unnamed protein product [Rotaria sp. Silwood2]|nr:unnamed protein product [Rotaria sp. Silwood2]CAF3009033.1 unnamed protein product [Rotaria sp. Silwood2]CAF3266512.1 unnamed protein product [Rotaria sp. Silwood2]CAF4454538.1 unnamed protein product [Rotaria sp. Silwood2]CAF4494070.1 unnamed protein product [Rotaria sp. Silwood2]
MARRSSQKTHRRRDPNAPKRSKTAWQMFFSDNREEVKVKQNPNLNGQEISKKLGEMWRQSDDAIKRRYQNQHQSSETEYNEKMAAYKEEKNRKSQTSYSGKNKKNQSSNSKQNSGQSNKENMNDEDNDQM